MSETTDIVKQDAPDLALARVEGGSLWLDPRSFEHIQRVAKMFSQSALVPKHFQGQLADCAIAVQMAFRLGVDPYMLMQRTYVVQGKPGMEAQLVIALVNARGPFAGPIQWRFEGQAGADTWQCTAYAKLKASGEPCEATVSWRMVKAEGWADKPGSKWKTMPEQMFRYRSAAFLARLYCPEVTMGMPTADELADIAAIPTTATAAPGPIGPAPAPVDTTAETVTESEK